ncbi:reverse transcriptase domain-containing protein [Tanacetum coccineum]
MKSRNWVNTYAVVNTMLLSDIEDNHGPSDAMHNPPYPLKVSQQTLASFLTEITRISIDFLTPNSTLQAGNPIKEILLKLNLPDHRILKDGGETGNTIVEGTKMKLTQIEDEKVEEAPSSQIVGYYLKHKINKKLVEGFVKNQNFNDSLLATRIDFVILDIKEDEKRPFILGTPFLTTTKAVIKFDKRTLTLRSGKSKVSFHMIPDHLCRIKKGIKNDIEPITPTITVNRLILEWEEKIKLHQEKEMKFNQWRSKIFYNA